MKAKSPVYLYARWGHLVLKMQHSTTRQAKQKIRANLDHHWSIKCSFLWVQTNRVCPSGTQRYCENDSDSSLESLTVTRVESFCEKRDSSRVTIFLNSSRVNDSSHAVTGTASACLTTAELRHIHYNIYCLWRNKHNSFHNVMTMDDLIKNYSNRMYQRWSNRGSLSFPKNCIFNSTYCKV